MIKPLCVFRAYVKEQTWKCNIFLCKEIQTHCNYWLPNVYDSREAEFINKKKNNATVTSNNLPFCGLHSPKGWKTGNMYSGNDTKKEHIQCLWY